jgi:hypothetical protein
MTLQEMNEAVNIQKALERLYETVDSLRARATPGAVRLDGMPRGNGYRDAVGEYAVEIADLTAEISRLEDALELAQDRNEAFIETIPEAKARTIMRLRFVRCMTWEEVAYTMGPYYTTDGVQRPVYKVLKKRETAHVQHIRENQRETEDQYTKN